MNIERIIAIFGLTFCTTLIATGFDSYVSIINAVLVSGIAMFTEIKTESEPMANFQKIINKALIV